MPRPTQTALAFDVYGTLVDLHSVVSVLEPTFGPHAIAAARLWREKQLEFAFRRSMMRRYANFDVCTAQAFSSVLAHFSVAMGADEAQQVLRSYRRLPLFPDVDGLLEQLMIAGYRLMVFSNGTKASLNELLERRGVLEWLEQVISVDDVRTFKPDPATYNYLVQSVGLPKENIWLVSSNAWDVVGAASCGLRTVWVNRQPAPRIELWDFEPDIIVSDLTKLVEALERTGPGGAEHPATGAR